MDSFVLSLLYQGLATAAFLILCSIGLMIILGMMNIINLAHGEIMMIGAYVATILASSGVPFFATLPVCFVVWMPGGIFYRDRVYPVSLRPASLRSGGHLGGSA